MACGIRHVLVNTYNGAWLSDVTPKKCRLFFSIYIWVVSMCTVYHFVPLCDDAFRQHHDALFSLCTMYFPYDSGGRDRGKRFRGTSTGAGSKESLSRGVLCKRGFFSRNVKGPSLSCKRSGMVWANFCYFEGSGESENDLRELSCGNRPNCWKQMHTKIECNFGGNGLINLIRMKRFSELI